MQEIKKISFLDGSLRYSEYNETIAICIDDFFGQLWPAQKAAQKKVIEDNCDILFEIEGDGYFSIHCLQKRILEHKPQKASYLKSPVNFKNYITFIQNGGFNAVFEAMTGEKGSFVNKDISYLFDSAESEVNNIDLENEIAELQLKNDDLLDSIKWQNIRIDSLLNEKKEIESEYNLIKQSKSDLELELSEMNRKLQYLEVEAKNSSMDWLRTKLTNPKMMLWATILVIGIFLTFTVLSLKQYIAIDSPNIFTTFLLYVLCVFIASAWDFSILLFAVNGKRNLAMIGSCFQFVFISAKFDFFKIYVELIGFNGMLFQKIIVITAICIYSPLLVFQFAELAMKGFKANDAIK